MAERVEELYHGADEGGVVLRADPLVESFLHGRARVGGAGDGGAVAALELRGGWARAGAAGVGRWQGVAHVGDGVLVLELEV